MNSRPWLAALCSVAIAGAGLVAADHEARRRYGRPPRRDPVEPDSSLRDAIDVEIRAVDGATLRGWLRESPSTGPSAAALVLHGWGGSAADMLPVSEVLVALGLHVLLLDARGHGRSDDGAVVSMPSFADDVRVALGWMRSAPQVDSSRILLVGHSVGAGACLFVASEDPDVAAVVSLASMADPSSFMAQRLRRFMPASLASLALRYVEHAIGHRFAEFAPIYTIARTKAPVLLVHGLRDTTVPVADAYRLLKQAGDRTTLLVVPDGDHYSIEALDSVRTDLLHFLESASLMGSHGCSEDEQL